MDGSRAVVIEFGRRLFATLGVPTAMLMLGCAKDSEPWTSCVEAPPASALVCYDPSDAPGSATSIDTSADGSTGTTAGTTESTSTGSTDATASASTGVTEGSDGTTTSSEGTFTPASSGETAAGVCDGFLEGPPGMRNSEWYGPYEMDGQCCFQIADAPATSTSTGVDEWPGGECGRPLAIEGRARKAEPRARVDWLVEMALDVADLDVDTREALARAWMTDAAAEHASVAAFARFVLELLAVGAPPDLVRDAGRAMGDEVEHARLSYALASAYAGRPIGPGPLEMRGIAPATSLAEVAVAAAREGCVAETLAALEAAAAAHDAVDPVVRAVLERIADDELRHAALSWRAVAWAIEHGGESVRREVAAAFDFELGPVPEPSPCALAGHGRLDAAQRHVLRARGLAEIVRPLARSLLGVGRESKTAPSHRA